jgi:hypothetical protein
MSHNIQHFQAERKMSPFTLNRQGGNERNAYKSRPGGIFSASASDLLGPSGNERSSAFPSGNQPRMHRSRGLGKNTSKSRWPRIRAASAAQEVLVVPAAQDSRAV